MADAVESYLGAALLLLCCRRKRRGERVLHPRVVDYVLKGRPISRPQGQTPLNELLTLCRRQNQIQLKIIIIKKTNLFLLSVEV